VDTDTRRRELMRRYTLAYWILFVIALLLTVVITAPANWMARKVARESDGRVVLADASGTLWHGSAVLAIGGTPGQPSIALALPGRISWDFAGLSGIGGRFVVSGGGIPQPFDVDLSFGHVKLAPATATIPCELLDAIGGMMQTLALRCQATIGWQTLSWPAAPATQNSGSVSLFNVTSALAAVRPLGDYRVDWQAAADGTLKYQLSTSTGALMLAGQGTWPGGFEGTAQIAPSAPPDVHERLRAMLATLGAPGAQGTLLKY
jgi:general secretion pathway protein N